jgi:hypothetical protein
MALFKPIKLPLSELADVEKKDGQFLIATDTGQAFVDVDSDNRMPILGGGAVAFTFVVDSDEALAAWANNAEGNDYSHVLIKSGEWTSSKEVNLTTSGTKVVVGQAGSLLSFTSLRGLAYSGGNPPRTNDYWMNGVNVKVSNNASYCFFYCMNLTNCSGSSIGSSGGYGFYYCYNLTNCTGSTEKIGNSSGYFYGFSYCTNLVNCTGNTNGNDGFCFYYCTNLTNCSGTANGARSYGFINCKSLRDCTCIVNTPDDNNGYGSSGFKNCTNLVNCTGNTNASYSYGFESCRIMMFCNGTSTTSVYNACFMHASGTDDPVADTAAGGWNRS